MKTIKPSHIRLELKWYHGSLDFPCEFCCSNSYQNYHIQVGDKLISICEDCLKKAKEEDY